MKQLDTFIEEIKNIFNDSLKSIFVYGSCADNAELKHNINLMIISENLNAKNLKAVQKSIAKWVFAKNPIPVFVTPFEWQCSADVYAMEYADIKDKHKILYGENLIDNTEIRREDLRFQCEYETKNLLMRLRNFYIKGDFIHAKDVFMSSAKTLLVIFRTILRLNYTNIPNSDEEVIKLACQSAGISPLIFLMLLSNKKNEQKVKKDSYNSVFDSLFDEIPKLLCYINSL